MKRDDSSLTPQQFARVRAEAMRVLRESGAFGRFPTPVHDILQVAKLEEVKEDVLNQGFLEQLRRKAGRTLKSALSKVIGLFDVKAGLVFIDRTLYVAKQTFLRLHEIAHGFMPWQKDLYAVIEECDQTLDPETADLFDREANAFASEVLFQIDTFTEEAESVPFGILAPVRLHKKYGASIYSAVRQYVSKNHRACVVLVLNPPELVKGGGFTSALRRVVASPRFVEAFGNIDWPNHFTPSDTIGSMIPLGKRRMSGKRSIFLTDKHKSAQPCAAEAFTQTHQVFILIHAVGISSSPIILP